MKKVLSNFALEPDQKLFLEELARKTDRKQSSLVREAIDLLRTKYQREQPDPPAPSLASR